jgi:hypothetical protein
VRLRNTSTGTVPRRLDPVSGYLLLLLACGAELCALVGKRDKRILWASLLVAFALAGLGRTLASHPPVDAGDVSYYNDVDSLRSAPQFITGVISAEPLNGDRSQQLRITSETVRNGASGVAVPIKGLVLAILPPYPEYSFGERLVLEGTLTTPPVLGDFDYAG